MSDKIGEVLFTVLCFSVGAVVNLACLFVGLKLMFAIVEMF